MQREMSRQLHRRRACPSISRRTRIRASSTISSACSRTPLKPHRGDQGLISVVRGGGRRDRADGGAADGGAIPGAGLLLIALAACWSPTAAAAGSSSASSPLRSRFSASASTPGRPHDRSPGAKEVRAFGLADADHASAGTSSGTEYLVAICAPACGAGPGWPSRAARCDCSASWRSCCCLYWSRTTRSLLADAGAAALALLLLSARIEGLASGGGGLYESSLFLDDLDRFLEDRSGHLEARPVDHRLRRGFGELRAEGLGFRYPGRRASAIEDVEPDDSRGRGRRSGRRERVG